MNKKAGSSFGALKGKLEGSARRDTTPDQDGKLKATYVNLDPVLWGQFKSLAPQKGFRSSSEWLRLLIERAVHDPDAHS